MTPPDPDRPRLLLAPPRRATCGPTPTNQPMARTKTKVRPRDGRPDADFSGRRTSPKWYTKARDRRRDRPCAVIFRPFGFAPPSYISVHYPCVDTLIPKISENVQFSHFHARRPARHTQRLLHIRRSLDVQASASGSGSGSRVTEQIRREDFGAHTRQHSNQRSRGSGHLRGGHRQVDHELGRRGGARRGEEDLRTGGTGVHDAGAAKLRGRQSQHEETTVRTAGRWGRQRAAIDL